MIKLLSDKSIRELARVPSKDYGASPNWWLRANQRVARKAEKEVLRQVAEWGEETCPHDLFGEGTQCYKHACDGCWAELQKQAEEKK